MNYNKLSAALKVIGIEGEQQKINKVFGTWYFVVEKNIFFASSNEVTQANVPF